VLTTLASIAQLDGGLFRVDWELKLSNSPLRNQGLHQALSLFYEHESQDNRGS